MVKAAQKIGGFMPRLKKLAAAFTPLLIVTALTVWSGTALAMKHECKQLSKTALEHIADGKKVHVIFFASWCPGCKDHLMMKHKEPTIVVNVWDKPDRAVAALKFTKVDTDKFPCFFDDKEILAKGLKVPELPYATDVDSKKLKDVLKKSVK